MSAFSPEAQIILRQGEVEWMAREWPMLELIGFLGSKSGADASGTEIGAAAVLPAHLQWLQNQRPLIKFY